MQPILPNTKNDEEKRLAQEAAKDALKAAVKHVEGLVYTNLRDPFRPQGIKYLESQVHQQAEVQAQVHQQAGVHTEAKKESEGLPSKAKKTLQRMISSDPEKSTRHETEKSIQSTKDFKRQSQADRQQYEQSREEYVEKTADELEREESEMDDFLSSIRKK